MLRVDSRLLTRSRYVMLANVNDSLTDAKQLGQLLSGT